MVVVKNVDVLWSRQPVKKHWGKKRKESHKTMRDSKGKEEKKYAQEADVTKPSCIKNKYT